MECSFVQNEKSLTSYSMKLYSLRRSTDWMSESSLSVCCCSSVVPYAVNYASDSVLPWLQQHSVQCSRHNIGCQCPYNLPQRSCSMVSEWMAECALCMKVHHEETSMLHTWLMAAVELLYCRQSWDSQKCPDFWSVDISGIVLYTTIYIWDPHVLIKEVSL